MARFGHGSARNGYTLVEMLVATTLTLIMMGAVATVFGMIGEGISAARATLEMSDALRGTAQRLRADLEGVPVPLVPPYRPEENKGYVEYIEGTTGPSGVTDTGGNDNTVGDTDDILMFTTRSRGEPFVGRVGGVATESQDAEIAWFVRGRTLYRRVLLVRPDLGPWAAGSASGFYNANDLSVRLDRDSSGTLTLVANSLGDLTKRECRYAHHYRGATAADDDTYPFSASRWGRLGLPTLGECSHGNWAVDQMNPVTVFGTVTLPNPNVMDFWSNTPFSTWSGVDPGTGELTAYAGSRADEDVILSNVIGFDVKAWDPGAPVTSNGSVVLLPGDSSYPGSTVIGYGAYVDLGYGGSSQFGGFSWDYSDTNPPYGPRSELTRTYDTWSLHYEYDGIKETGNRSGLAADAGTNGFDDDGNGLVDDWNEMETQAPYPVPLRGIQIKIRVFEPDSRQIREVTIVQSFLPE